MLADEADHGEGAQGLAQVVQGDAGNGRMALVDEGRDPWGEPAAEGIGSVLAGGPEKIGGLEGGVPGVLIIGQAEGDARLPAPPFQEAVDVVDAASVAVDAAVEHRPLSRREILRKPAPCPICPGVKVLTTLPRLFFQKMQLSFQAGIQDGATDAVLPQAAGQSRNTGRRLAGLGNGGMDQEKMGDGKSPF